VIRHAAGVARDDPFDAWRDFLTQAIGRDRLSQIEHAALRLLVAAKKDQPGSNWKKFFGSFFQKRTASFT
jgi:hypothetical protein